MNSFDFAKLTDEEIVNNKIQIFETLQFHERELKSWQRGFIHKSDITFISASIDFTPFGVQSENYFLIPGGFDRIANDLKSEICKGITKEDLHIKNLSMLLHRPVFEVYLGIYRKRGV
jgi:hypothetical protein